MKKAWVGLLGIVSALGPLGCSTGSFPGLGYLLQAGRGQLALSWGGRPLEEVMRDPQTSPELKRLLEETHPIREFGIRHGIKPTQSYQKYIQLDREAAVWVVTASDRLAFRSKVWSFPIAGSFHYLGWFDRSDANAYAQRLAIEGWDTDVRGAGAYSTLGWFDDPLLSTMISSGATAMGDWVNVLLHESVHATVFVKGQSSFNESLADTVADRLTSAYLQERFGASAPEWTHYRDAQARVEQRAKRLHAAYFELSSIYGSAALSDAQKLEKKKSVFEALRSELKIQREITNATLLGFKTYQTGKAGFDACLDACGGDVSRLLQRMSRLNEGDFPKEQVQEELDEFLLKVAQSGCDSAAPI